MKRLLLITAFLPTVLYAQNPVIRDQFAADPTARVFNGKVYLFPSHDILQPKPMPQGMRENWFCMEDYHVFSSDDLIEWTDHGVIINQKEVPWGNPTAYSMWAPDCVERNGKYYFYFPDAPKSGMGFGIGVAIADKPEGPYKPVANNIEGVNGIDPCVLQASDGNAYLFWGAGRCAKLKDNMIEIADDTPKEKVKWGEREFEMMGVNCLKGLPSRQAEGPFAFEYNGNYYLTYPYVRTNTEVLGYAMSKNPMGPYEYKGLIMAEHADSCWTNHHSIINFKGQWYLFYHHNDYSPNDDKRRSVRIEKLYFNPDGTIKEVKPTMRGVGVNNALSRIDVDRYNTASKDVNTDFVDSSDTFKGWFAGLKQKGSYIVYNDVNFADVKNRAYAIATVRANKNTKFSIREKNAKGKVIAEFNVTVVTEGRFRRDYSGQWLAVTAPLKYIPSGVTDLCIVADQDAIDVDAVEFKNRIEYYSNATGASSQPDNDGFVRRWNVLEPIPLDINTNILFTDSYLAQTLGDPKVQALIKNVPNDRQQVKYDSKTTLTWHKIESNFYNVKLFRFAEQYGTKIYGVIFPVTTVIECDDDMQGVRLMAGSNSASKWYLNGEEILTMSGDRRMVRDDCASKSITLRKGTNVLSGLIINGPGMSDFCVRFIDKNGNTVKNFKVK